MRERRLFAVGDIHGCADELEALLSVLPVEPEDTLVFLGDYLDRGPSPAGVLARLCRLRRERPGTVFLRGNHEDMCLAFLGRAGRHGDVFTANGGDRTAASYGAPADDPAALARAMPREHLAFLEATRASHAQDGVLCVHAGIRPGVPLAAQQPADLFWIRGEFVEARHDLGCTVVFGHTPVSRVLVDLPWKIGIDTGCVYGGLLTALELPAGRVYQVPRGGDRAWVSPLDAPALA